MNEADKNEILALEREGVAAHQAGNLPLARSKFEQILAIDPNHVTTLHRLGTLLNQMGDANSAVRIFKRALALNLKDTNAQVGYGMAMLIGGAVQDALNAGLHAHKVAPTHIPAMRLSAMAAMNLRKWGVLLQVCERWKSVAPNDPAVINYISCAYFEMREFERATDTYKVLLNTYPEDPQIWTTYARSCLAMFDYENTLRALEKAQTLTAPSAEMLYTLSRTKMFLGDLEGAEHDCLEAINTDPSFPLSYAHLSTLRHGRVEQSFVEKMRDLASRNSVIADQRASLNFSLGQISEREGEYSRAMQFFNAGNKITGEILRHEGIAYDPDAIEEMSARERKICSELPNVNVLERSAVTPVFVIGMPRSGTTLVESIIAAHSEAHGAGELAVMPKIHDDMLKWHAEQSAQPESLPVEMLQQWRKDYVGALQKVSDKNLIVDKQPLNFRSIGLLRKLFPEAVIIHIRRNPVDTGLSIYRNDFGKAWPFATDMQNIAHFYGQYARAMEYWVQDDEAALITVQYETLVSDFENEARRLIKACDMEWQDECLAFHKAKRPVATFSSMQVREPMRKKAISAEEQYGELLHPLIRGIEQAGVDVTTGALIQQ